MNYLNKIIGVSLAFFIIQLNAQVTQEWVNRYCGPLNNYNSPSLITHDESGNVFVTGSSTGNVSGTDIITIKFNASGAIVWEGRYSGSSGTDDAATSIALDNSGNIYVSGWITNAGTLKDIIVIKYNSSGQLVWTGIYNGPVNSDDVANSMVLDGTGNVYITGYTSVSYASDFITIKYTPDGVLQWVKTYNGPANAYDEAFNINVHGAYVYVCGLSRGTDTKRDYATIKYSSSGEQLWMARYNGPSFGYDMAYAIAVDDFENVYVTGTSWDWYYGYDYLTLMYNSTGDEQWNARYDGGAAGSDIAKSIKIDQNRNVYVSGEVWTTSFKDYGTVKYDHDGNLLWARTYNGPGNSNDIANSMVMDNSGNLYVTGWSRNTSNFGTEDFCTVKYNSNGIQKWVIRYNGTGNDEDIANAISVDLLGNAYVTGRSKLSTNNYEISTIKYSQPIGIEPISGNFPDKFALHQNYPNPFNPVTIINFDISKSSIVKLIVFDLLGRELTILIDEYLQEGQYSFEWDAEDYPSGIYFYKLISYSSYLLERSDGYTDTKKMILIK